MNVLEAIETRRSVKHYDPEHVMPDEDLARLIGLTKLSALPADHVLSFMIAVGKGTKSAWPRGERLPDSTVVIHDKF